MTEINLLRGLSDEQMTRLDEILGNREVTRERKRDSPREPYTPNPARPERARRATSDFVSADLAVAEYLRLKAKYETTNGVARALAAQHGRDVRSMRSLIRDLPVRKTTMVQTLQLLRSTR